jgi:hypothetical protein
MPGTGQAPAPAPQIVQIDIREFVDLLVRKLADEHIQPLRDVTNELKTEVALIKDRLDEFDVVPEPADTGWKTHVKTAYLTLGSTGALILFLIQIQKWMKGS